jgi:hypothetical protein
LTHLSAELSTKCESRAFSAMDALEVFATVDRLN